MFTGIIREIGVVTAAGRGVGGSVAVNGVCLTATSVSDDGFSAQVVDETLRRSNLGALQAGSRVNLELPLQAGGPLDGHLVLGHVDGVGEVLHTADAQLGREMTVRFPPEVAPYIAEKGSIAVDGASLTITTAGERSFGVALIPHTLAQTIAREYRPGTSVNLEVDVIARYVERLVRTGIGRR